MRREENLYEGAKIWTEFYRKNIHRFIDDFFDGINLFTFQKIWVFLLNINLVICLICSRGLSKSYTLAVFMVAKCILYPGTQVVISTETKNTSRRLISDKIKRELYDKSSNIRREIEDIKIGTNESSVTFKNGSIIVSLNASENTRGQRANILIVEYCLVI